MISVYIFEVLTVENERHCDDWRLEQGREDLRGTFWFFLLGV